MGTLSDLWQQNPYKGVLGKYSMVMCQRLGLVQALMDDLELLILDEPINGLDNQGVRTYARS